MTNNISVMLATKASLCSSFTQTEILGSRGEEPQTPSSLRGGSSTHMGQAGTASALFLGTAEPPWVGQAGAEPLKLTPQGSLHS